jgi:hypothetical protein
MIKDDAYYDALDIEFTDNLPDIDESRNGSLTGGLANIIILSEDDMRIASSMANNMHTTVNDYVSRVIRKELASA